MKPLFSNRVKSHRIPDLVEKDNLIDGDQKIAKIFKEYLVHIVQKLGIVIKKSSIFSNLSKIYERIMYNQICPYFNILFSKFQCGFRKGLNAHCLLKDILHFVEEPYNLRNNSALKRRCNRSVYFGTETKSYLAPKI